MAPVIDFWVSKLVDFIGELGNKRLILDEVIKG